MKKILILFAYLILLSGCEYGRMYDQPNPRPKTIVQQKVPKNIVKSTLMHKAQKHTENPYKLTEENIKQGAIVYRQFCYHCHGADGKGNTHVGYGFPVSPSDLNDEGIRKKPDSSLYSHIYYGGKYSPALGAYMTDEEIWKVIQYIKYREKNK